MERFLLVKENRLKLKRTVRSWKICSQFEKIGLVGKPIYSWKDIDVVGNTDRSWRDVVRTINGNFIFFQKAVVSKFILKISNFELSK